ncbi:MAG: GHKL domain-containing protein [Deltaproteobacteria bacterium]|nr:GHKL domain-containing protein [Deltaproteobacteria bacterium]
MMRERIKWLMTFRVAFVLVMGATGAALQSVYHDPIAAELIFLLKAGIGFSLIAIPSFYFLKNSRAISIHAWTQIIWDIGYTSALVYVTGGLYSTFIMLYAIHILLTASVFLSRGALVAGAISALSLISVGIFQVGKQIYLEPNLFSRSLFSASALLLFGAFVAFLFKNREQLAKNLEKTSADLKGLNDLHSAIVDHVPSGILYSDAHANVQLMNQAALQILERSYVGENLKRSNIEFLIKSDGRFESDFKSEKSQKIIGHHLTKLPNGGWVIVFQDVTQIRELETKVQLQDKLASVGQLAAGIAHEIRNPLASLSGSIQLLKSEMSIKESSDKLMKIVLRETDRLDHLLQSFLNYAKPSHLQLERINVSEFVDEILSLIKNQPAIQSHKISIKTSIDKNLFCFVDPRHLKQIFWNLIKNSIEAIRESGEILIKASERDHDGEAMIVFSVEDTGAGISKEILDKVFDPFFSTKDSGTGLGLALVYQLVKSHSGQMGVESEPTRGTKFWFALLKDGPAEERSLSAASGG